MDPNANHPFGNLYYEGDLPYQNVFANYNVQDQEQEQAPARPLTTEQLSTMLESTSIDPGPLAHYGQPFLAHQQWAGYPQPYDPNVGGQFIEANVDALLGPGYLYQGDLNNAGNPMAGLSGITYFQDPEGGIHAYNNADDTTAGPSYVAFANTDQFEEDERRMVDADSQRIMDEMVRAAQVSEGDESSWMHPFNNNPNQGHVDLDQGLDDPKVAAVRESSLEAEGHDSASEMPIIRRNPRNQQAATQSESRQRLPVEEDPQVLAYLSDPVANAGASPALLARDSRLHNPGDAPDIRTQFQPSFWSPFIFDKDYNRFMLRTDVPLPDWIAESESFKQLIDIGNVPSIEIVTSVVARDVGWRIDLLSNGGVICPTPACNAVLTDSAMAVRHCQEKHPHACLEPSCSGIDPGTYKMAFDYAEALAGHAVGCTPERARFPCPIITGATGKKCSHSHTRAEQEQHYEDHTSPGFVCRMPSCRSSLGSDFSTFYRTSTRSFRGHHVTDHADAFVGAILPYCRTLGCRDAGTVFECQELANDHYKQAHNYYCWLEPCRSSNWDSAFTSAEGLYKHQVAVSHTVQQRNNAGIHGCFSSHVVGPVFKTTFKLRDHIHSWHNRLVCKFCRGEFDMLPDELELYQRGGDRKLQGEPLTDFRCPGCLRTRLGDGKGGLQQRRRSRSPPKESPQGSSGALVYRQRYEY